MYMKSKKDHQREIESIIRYLSPSTKEKTKVEYCTKLLTIFESSLEVDIDFDSLLKSINEFADRYNPICNKIWIQVVNQIIRFRPHFRGQLYDKAMKIAFELSNDDTLKLKTLHFITNCCMDIPVWEDRIYEFLIFECLLNPDLPDEKLFIMISHLIKMFNDKISLFMHEFVIETIIIISFMKISSYREKEPSKTPNLEEEKVHIKSIFQLLENYMINCNDKNNSLVFNIIRVYCFYVNYEKDYSWMMMRKFIIKDSKIFKFFLDLITYDNFPINYVFFDKFLYFSLDEIIDEQKIKFFQDRYNIFKMRIGDLHKLVAKHKERIIKGAIYFIGMSQWSYERIEKIDATNSILLLKFIKPVTVTKIYKKIDTEIIFCLKRLIKKYGEELIDEWKEILTIIMHIRNNNKETSHENISKTILEIIDIIKILIINDKFNGNIDEYVKLIDEYKFYGNDSMYLLKTKFKLYKYYDFHQNIEEVFIEIINSKNERIKNHIMEMLRINYKNLTFKVEKIENIIIKFLTTLLFSLAKDETLLTFALLISTICVHASEQKFIEIMKIIFTSLSVSSQESEKVKSIHVFQKNCLILIYKSLINFGQKEKIEFFHKRIFAFLKEPKDINFFHTLIKFLKTMKINKDYELSLSGYNSNSNSEVCINFLCSSPSKQKRNKKMNEIKKVSRYYPYVTFKHNKLYEILVEVINKDETNYGLCEEILDLLNHFLKNFYFFKSIKIEKLLNSILLIKEIEKFLIRNKMIEIIIDVLFNISFITNNFSLNSDDNNEDNMKERIINFCLRSLVSFINYFKTFINKKLMPDNNRSTFSSNNSSKIKEAYVPDYQSQSSQIQSELNQNPAVKNLTSHIKNFFSLLSVYFISSPDSSKKDKEKMKKYNDYAIQIIDLIYEMRIMFKLKPSLMVSIICFILKTKSVFLMMSNEVVVKIIYLLLSIGWPEYEAEIYKHLGENFGIKLKKFNELQSMVEIKKGGGDLSSNLTLNHINALKINYHKKEYINHLTDVGCFYYLEHFNNNKIILKIITNVFKSKHHREKIFIDLIKWNIYSKSIRDNLRSDYRAKFLENSQIYLGSNCILMIIPINECSAELIIRNPISNINITIYNKIENSESSELSNYDKLNCIINNIKLPEENNNETLTKLNDKIEIEDNLCIDPSQRIRYKKIYSKKFEPLLQSDENNKILTKTSHFSSFSESKFSPSHLINPNMVLHQFLNIFSDYESSFQTITNMSSITENIKILDSTPVYFTYSCGVLYIPNQNLNTNSEIDIFSYDGEVSSEYLKFLSKIGKLFNLKDNPNIYAGGLDRNGSHGNFSIYHQDILYQIIYNVSSLMTREKNSNNNNNTIPNKKIEENSDIHFSRKKVIGNNLVNIIFFDNIFEGFDVDILKSSLSFFYILIFPYSTNLYFIKLKPNSKSIYNMTDKVFKSLFKEIIINYDNLDIILKTIIILLNMYISYVRQKKAYKAYDSESNPPNNKSFTHSFEFDSNITERFKQIERITFNYKP